MKLHTAPRGTTYVEAADDTPVLFDNSTKEPLCVVVNQDSILRAVNPEGVKKYSEVQKWLSVVYPNHPPESVTDLPQAIINSITKEL